MFTESDRVQIRKYLGYSALFLQLDPRLESAISTIQSVADGGTRPDSSSEDYARQLIASCQDVDTKLTNLDSMMGMGRMDDASFDPAKEDLRLRRKGRMYVFRLAKLLDTVPRANVFGTGTTEGDDFRAGPGYGVPGNGRTAY